MKQNITLLILFISFSFSLQSQNYLSEIQGGLSVKTTIDIGKHTNYNISIIGGVGLYPFEFEYIYPTINAGFAIYNRGEFISSYKNGFWKTYLDCFLNLTMTAGKYRESIDFKNRFVPLYHFSDLLPTPLNNPFQHSISIGSNLVFPFFDGSKEIQQVGYSGLMIDRHFQFNIYNDGSIWAKYKLGDEEDRYFTGGGAFSYHIDSYYFLNQFELSFHKFTGFEMDTFEVSNALQLDFIPYQKEETFYYNKNRWRFSTSNYEKNFSLHITLPNTDKDIQDNIHFNRDYTYHQDIFDNESGWANELRRIQFGTSFLFLENNLK